MMEFDEVDEQQYDAVDLEPELPVVDLPSEDHDVAGTDQDLTVDGVMSSYYSGYMSGYLSGLQDGGQTDAEVVLDAELDEDMDLVGVETYALSPITTSTGLKGVLLEVLGPYDNVVTQFTYRANGSTNLSYVNEVTPDYPWIGSCLLFIAMIVCLFQLVRRAMGWMQ